MLSTVERAALAFYRRRRKTLAPEQALQQLVDHFRYQSELTRGGNKFWADSLANDLELTARRANELGDLVTDRRGWETPYARFWQTGRMDYQRGWVVMGLKTSGWSYFVSECPDAGCAIKHGLHLFTKPDWVKFVVHPAGDWNSSFEVDRETTADMLAIILGGD